MESIQLSITDISILLLYFVFIVWWALKHGKSKDSESYFLAGRQMTWPVVGLSLFAASVSSSTFMGHSGEGFISGIAVFNYNWVSIIVMVFFLIFFLPFYLRSGIYTMPEFLERRFDRRSRVYFSLVTIVGNVFLDAAAALYTGALIIKMIIPDAEFMWIVIIMGLVAGSYTIIGGLSSAVNADFIQALILLIGSAILMFFAFDEIGGWSEFYERFNDGVWLRLTRPMDDPTVPWLGMIFGIPILGFYFWCNNQVIVQRVLSARSINQGRKGVLFVGFLYLFTLFIFIMPGLIGRGINLFGVEHLPHQIIDGLELKNEYGINTDEVYPRLILELLPVGLIGLILATMVSALTSTLSATISSASTLFTMDFYTKLKPNAGNKELVKVGRLTALMVLILAMLWAPFIQKFDSLVAYYQEVISYLSPPVVGAFFMGLFWKRSNANGAFWSLISGLIMAAVLMIWKYVFKLDIGLHFLILAPIMMVVSLMINVLVSYAGDKPDKAKIDEYTYSKRVWQQDSKELEGVKWYNNFRVLSLLLVATCLGMYCIFF
ncbi:sodium:solute symporter [Anaerophaga thermohalophila]|uniref:sodium:solute symporter n=1 Tax=Anaerophaga thermohalophila TaxID=177400 RepID=UPI000237D5A9|nr:sodium:solute symporter [Anaerophaga thermohalophila]